MALRLLSADCRELMELLVKLNAERELTVVVITHDPGIARGASRTVQMRDGRLVQEGRRLAEAAR